MSTLKQVRAAFRTVLEANIAGTKTYHRITGNLVLPCIVVMPATADYLVTNNRGGDLWEIDLHALVPSADEEVAQDLLDDYVTGTGAKSIPTVLHANRTLGLADVSLAPARMTAYNFRFEAVGVPHVGATVRVRVLLTN